jgi:hypothetical protein
MYFEFNCVISIQKQLITQISKYFSTKKYHFHIYVAAVIFSRMIVMELCGFSMALNFATVANPRLPRTSKKYRGGPHWRSQFRERATRQATADNASTLAAADFGAVGKIAASE